MGRVLTDFTPSRAVLSPFLPSESLVVAGLLKAKMAKKRHFSLSEALESFSGAQRAKLVAQKLFGITWDGF